MKITFLFTVDDLVQCVIDFVTLEEEIYKDGIIHEKDLSYFRATVEEAL